MGCGASQPPPPPPRPVPKPQPPPPPPPPPPVEEVQIRAVPVEPEPPPITRLPSTWFPRLPLDPGQDVYEALLEVTEPLLNDIIPKAAAACRGQPKITELLDGAKAGIKSLRTKRANDHALLDMACLLELVVLVFREMAPDAQEALTSSAKGKKVIKQMKKDLKDAKDLIEAYDTVKCLLQFLSGEAATLDFEEIDASLMALLREAVVGVLGLALPDALGGASTAADAAPVGLYRGEGAYDAFQAHSLSQVAGTALGLSPWDAVQAALRQGPGPQAALCRLFGVDGSTLAEVLKTAVKNIGEQVNAMLEAGNVLQVKVSDVTVGKKGKLSRPPCPEQPMDHRCQARCGDGDLKGRQCPNSVEWRVQSEDKGLYFWYCSEHADWAKKATKATPKHVEGAMTFKELKKQRRRAGQDDDDDDDDDDDGEEEEEGEEDEEEGERSSNRKDKDKDKDKKKKDKEKDKDKEKKKEKKKDKEKDKEKKKDKKDKDKKKDEKKKKKSEAGEGDDE